jgi:general secretion pathway protein J
LQKVEYWYADGSLERRGYSMLDGAVAGEPSPLLESIDAVTMRYRDEKGDWRDNWQPTQPDLLPRAVEMVITRKNEAPLTLLFLVGPGAKTAQTEADQ